MIASAKGVMSVHTLQIEGINNNKLLGRSCFPRAVVTFHIPYGG